MSAATDYAQEFAQAMCRHHAAQLHSGDEDIKNAIIVKMVSLLALAFDIPPKDDEPIDVEEIIDMLKKALAVIDQAGKPRLA